MPVSVLDRRAVVALRRPPRQRGLRWSIWMAALPVLPASGWAQTAVAAPTAGNVSQNPTASSALDTASNASRTSPPAAPDRQALLAEADVSLERVDVIGTRPATMPTEIPTTIHSITGEQIQRTTNATDSEDALKYFPSLNVRRRYIGDYDHAVLASRASGTGNSARSLVYADGILLSNLLGNGAAYTPRWGLVTPEEIERVDVLYGPFSAAYPGNSAGAVVDFTTRMPTTFEAHLKLQGFTQRFKLYDIDEHFGGGAASATLGGRSGALSWWLNVNHLSSDGQPIVFANRLLSAGTAGNAGVPVTGAIAGSNPSDQPWLILGDTTRTHTAQDHAKVKIAYDFQPTLRVTYTFGEWTNHAQRDVASYLRDAAGNPVYGSAANPKVHIGGRDYTLATTDFTPTLATLDHVIQALDAKSHTGGTWDWEASASSYDYRRDQTRMPTTFMPASAGGGAGRITDLGGTGWNTLAVKGIWRPVAEHVVEAGLQRDAFRLRTKVVNTSDWISGDEGSAYSGFTGDTTLSSAWAQDAWRFLPGWRAVVGGRLEHWRATDGGISNATSTQRLGERSESHISPKAALSFAPDELWMFKGSAGRGVRMPTVAELYQGTISGDTIVNNNPNLKPEKSWTEELSAERDFGAGLVRATFFHEYTTDALYSQTNFSVTPNVTNIQNVGAIRTSGVELAAQGSDLVAQGFDLAGSLTFADSIIVRNDNFPASVGHWQPRVPRWRASLLGTWRSGERWSFSTGLRYSGRQYGTLDNSDPNGFAYTGVSSFVVADVRLQVRLAKQWTLAAGIDNLNNKTYWAFHPYPQRTLHAELRFDL